MFARLVRVANTELFGCVNTTGSVVCCLSEEERTSVSLGWIWYRQWKVQKLIGTISSTSQSLINCQLLLSETGGTSQPC